MRHVLLSPVKTREDNFSTRAEVDRRVLWIFGALMVAALIPLMAVQIPPLSDYPNHLARVHILLMVDAIPALAENYTVQWGVIPNLAFDVLVFLLAQVMPLLDAGRLFVGLVMVLNVVGVLTLHYAVHRRLSLMPALIFLVLYNQVLSWGLLNFLFGLGVVLMLFAGWIRTQHWQPWPRLAVFSVGALLVFFCHLLALASYGLLILAFEVWRLKEDGRTDIAGLLRRGVFRFGQFVPVALLSVLLVGSSEAEMRSSYGSVLEKVMAVTAPFRFHLEPVDVVTAVVMWGAFALGLVTRTIRIAPELRYPLVLLFVVAILIPRNASGVFGLDLRLFVLFMFVAIAGFELCIENRRVLYVIFVAALTLFVWRIAAMTALWQHVDARYAEFRDATKAMAEGTRLLAARRVYRNEATKFEQNADRGYLQMPLLATIDRAAFVPFSFTASYQPIRAHPRNAGIDTPAGNPIVYDTLRQAMIPEGYQDERGRRRYYADWPSQFDYVVIIDFGVHNNPVPEILRPLRVGSFFVLYENMQRRQALP